MFGPNVVLRPTAARRKRRSEKRHVGLDGADGLRYASSDATEDAGRDASAGAALYERLNEVDGVTLKVVDDFPVDAAVDASAQVVAPFETFGERG